MTDDDVRDALREVIDPELGINVVDLGLVQGIESGPSHLSVGLTMTSPACPLGHHMVEQAMVVLKKRFPAITLVKVALVWDPPWTPSRMSDAARQELGWT
jgi:metal-sulfur cluster biosynthetic enzyme